MKSFFLISFLFAVLISNLNCAKKITVSPAPVIADKHLDYVPFTKDLRDQLYSSNIDIKKIQFFIDQQLILKRSLGSEKADVKSGEIHMEKGEYVNEVIIPAFTPGILNSVNGDRLRISFELQNNEVEFAALNENTFFRLVGSNWNVSDGSADIMYENNKYKVHCGSCSSAGDAKLLVIKKEVDKLENNKRVVQGRKISQ